MHAHALFGARLSVNIVVYEDVNEVGDSDDDSGGDSEGRENGGGWNGDG